MKKYNLFKILGIVILFTIIISYFVPGTIISYGQVSRDSVMPVAFTDTFFNGLTSLNVFISTVVYILSIGFFYAILGKTEKYDALINGVARKFSRRKSLFIVLTVFVVGLLSASSPSTEHAATISLKRPILSSVSSDSILISKYSSGS